MKLSEMDREDLRHRMRVARIRTFPRRMLWRLVFPVLRHFYCPTCVCDPDGWTWDRTFGSVCACPQFCAPAGVPRVVAELLAPWDTCNNCGHDEGCHAATKSLS